MRALDPERRAKRKEAEERNAALIARLLDGARQAEVQWPPLHRGDSRNGTGRFPSLRGPGIVPSDRRLR
jgi:hypothetical protein